jgi:hypothetical protein
MTDDLMERIEGCIANAEHDDEHETLIDARDKINAQAAEIERLRGALMDVLVYAPEHIHGMPKKYYEKIAAGPSE